MKGIIESEINTISQEAIDDILIEDGRVVPDYIEDLKKVL